MNLLSRSLKANVLNFVLAISTVFHSAAYAKPHDKHQAEKNAHFITGFGWGYLLGFVPLIGTTFTTTTALILSSRSHTGQSETAKGILYGHIAGLATVVVLLHQINKHKGLEVPAAAALAASITLVLAASSID